VIEVPVDLGARGYRVSVGRGARHLLADELGALPGVRQAAVVTQPALAAAGWVEGLQAGVPVEVVLVGEAEADKSLAALSEVCRRFAVAGLTRHDVVVALGGGLVSDLAGFAAATFHRGMRYVNVPTTLLAQVDAGVGGKTGVNLPEGKNLVGAFWQPAAVLCDTELLETLPEREWASGRGEMAKYAFLGSGPPDASLLDLPIEEQVARCVAIKAAVVGEDETESGRRMVLNYGHTLAHALEAEGLSGSTTRDLRHGEAVAVGLVFAAMLARRLGRIGEDRVALHRRVVEGFGLDPRLPVDADPDRLVGLMGRDKKAHHDLTFVLDGGDGVEVVHGVEAGDVLATLKEMEGAR
jgi:5-deoxy-5-amino-3-dehydroquinate synthase